MIELYKKQILDLVTRAHYSPQKLTSLARQIGIGEQDYPEFKAAFKELQRKGKVVIDSQDMVVLPEMSGCVVGKFQANYRGFGFVVPLEPNSHGDLFIGPKDTADAMTSDIVMAKVLKRGFRGGQERCNGAITDIIERGRNKFIGTLQKHRDIWAVQPDGKGFFEPIVIDDIAAKGARADDKVVVEMVTYPSKGSAARGVIVEVLGKAGLYDAEIKSIIAQYNLPEEFESDCVDQARHSANNFDPDSDPSRDDITGEVVITIDPPDAKDFDDAISLKKNKDGSCILGVHIADVSTFIPMNSALDLEAKRRGNSVYLPGKVIPMLPEILSNGICSLQPKQKRFAKSAYITYDSNGNVTGREFANSLICSNARLTYNEADDILNGKAAGFGGEVVSLLKDMEGLAQIIEKRRVKKGMLHLELPETELVLDESGRVVDAEPADDSYPHTIIEMFMVEANEAVASLLDRFNTPFMRRIHPEPDSSRVKNLGRFVKICGLKIPRTLDRAAIQDLLAAVKGTSYSYPINLHVLRSLQKAEYAPLHIGHFALASTHYSHFTSPIRRYADLLIHRLLQCYLENKLNMIGLEEVLSEGELMEIGRHITFTELQSGNAEKELKNVLILQMLSEHIGEELNCVVSGLTNFGVFVQCMKFGIEGLIEFGDLGMDEWKYNEKSQAVTGLHSGKSIHLGQEITVTIASVSVPARQLYLTPAEPLVSSKHKVKGLKKQKRRGKKRK